MAQSKADREHEQVRLGGCRMSSCGLSQVPYLIAVNKIFLQGL
jgi:hypothetical protein